MQDNCLSLFKAKVYEITPHEFGYDIYKESHRLIHQPFIPGITGDASFATQEDAQKVADLMVYKLNKGIMPPSVSINELDSLKIRTSSPN